MDGEWEFRPGGTRATWRAEWAEDETIKESKGGGRARSRSARNTVGRSLGVRDSPLIRTGSKRSRSTRLPTTLAAQLLDTNPIGRRGAALAGRDETTSRQEV